MGLKIYILLIGKSLIMAVNIPDIESK